MTKKKIPRERDGWKEVSRMEDKKEQHPRVDEGAGEEGGQI